MMQKKISILGSTGSIGRSTLEVVKHLSQDIQVMALAAHSNIDLLEEQAKTFNPKLLAVYDPDHAQALQIRLPHIPVLAGKEGVNAVATFQDVDFVVSAIVGAYGVEPTLLAIEAGKSIGLANKETLVTAGELLIQKAKQKNVSIIPIDSEHSAIFQCLQGQKKEHVKRIILTASGGPFRQFSEEELEKVTVDCALKHPTWKMGKKVTIDCSTLMNKGLEVIEACYLFELPFEKIEVIIHPQSIVHSLVEFIDGSLLAQMGESDMKIPIQYALTYPERKPGIVSCFDFARYSKLEFLKPDQEKFLCLRLAFEAAKTGGSLPCYMNAANEVLVNRFLKGTISWKEIGRKLAKLMEKHLISKVHNLEAVFAIDEQGRREALEV